MRWLATVKPHSEDHLYLKKETEYQKILGVLLKHNLMKFPNFQAQLYQTAQKNHTHSLILIFQLNTDESYLVFSHVFSVIWCLNNKFRFKRIVIYILMSQHFNGFISKSNGWPLNKQVRCDRKNQSSILLLHYVWIDCTGLWYGKQHWERAVFHFVSSKVSRFNFWLMKWKNVSFLLTPIYKCKVRISFMFFLKVYILHVINRL